MELQNLRYLLRDAEERGTPLDVEIARNNLNKWLAKNKPRFPTRSSRFR